MKRIFAIGALLLGSVAMFAQPQLTKDNIDEVVAAMTLEEGITERFPLFVENSGEDLRMWL